MILGTIRHFSGYAPVNHEVDVFGWFCKETGTTNPNKGTRDAFKAAMKRRYNKA